MFSIRAARQRLCDGWSRRDFVRVGSLGAVGLSLPTLLQAASDPAGSRTRLRTWTENRNFGRAKRCILLFLTGGPPQLDTFDLKPDAPAEVRGELRPIATNVPGIRIGELLPRLARQADKYCLVRSVTHGDTVHPSAGYTMLTGVYHPQANAPGNAQSIRPSPNDHPHLGSLLARFRPARTGLPTFASLPEIIRDDAVNEYPGQDAGFLGSGYGPFRIQANSAEGSFPLPDIVLPADISGPRLQDRRVLLNQLDRRLLPALDVGTGRGSFYAQAFDLMTSPAARRAFALADEPDRLRSAYGNHLFGQGCLLARRLIEAGVSLVTVYWHYEGPQDSPVWDTHQNNFAHLRNRLLPPTDQAVATLLDDLAARGLLDETLVVCMGEFGRTPRINRQAGRDHWPHVQTVLLAGAGIRSGCVYGASDRYAAYPSELPVTPADLTATLLHVLGIRPDLELHDRLSRPVPVCQGAPVSGLLA